MRLAAGDDPIVEFGLRRAQGIDGGLAASRAAYAGGCDGTSNLLAGKVLGIPVKGTHAHSWVLAFDSELEAFEAYARALPNNCVFLVDTFDSLAEMEQWLDTGRAPDRIEAALLQSGVVTRTRPLCAHPNVTRYKAPANATATFDLNNSFYFGCVDPALQK